MLNKKLIRDFFLYIIMCAIYFVEIIGHLETEEGTDLGEVVIVNRGRIRSKSKLRRRKNRFTCQLCGRSFLQRSKYIVHK